MRGKRVWLSLTAVAGLLAACGVAPVTPPDFGAAAPAPAATGSAAVSVALIAPTSTQPQLQDPATAASSRP